MEHITGFAALWTAKLKAQATALAFSSDSKILCLGDSQGTLHVFDLLTGRLLKQQPGKKGRILALHLYDLFLYSFDDQGLFTQWHFSDMKRLKECSLVIELIKNRVYEFKDKNENFSHALFKPSNDSLIVVTKCNGMFMPCSKLYQLALQRFPDFGTISLNDQKNCRCRLPEADADNLIDGISLSRDGHQFVVTSCTSAGTFDGDWAYGCPEYITIFGDHFFECCYSDGDCPPRHIKNVACFSPDGKLVLVSANDEGYLYFLDCPATEISSIDNESFETKFMYPPESSATDTGFRYSENVSSLDWSPNGKIFAAGSSNGMVNIWNYPEKQLVCSKKNSHTSIEHLKFSPDGSCFVIISEDSQVTMSKITY